MNPGNTNLWTRSLLDRFKDLHVLIIGDIMIDRYLYGHVERISPEAPVPVLQYDHEECRPGGAANVALNVQALGARASVIAAMGTGFYSKMMKDIFDTNSLKSDYLLSEPGRMTTVKTRLSAGGHQLMRIDREQTDYITNETKSQIMFHVGEILAGDPPAVVILQDYDKGVLSPELIQYVIKISRENGVPVCVDPKNKHFFDFKGASLFKPNLKELSQALSKIITKSYQPISDAVGIMDQKLEAENYLITLSEAGIYYKSKETEGIAPIDRPVAVADVSGAGDTVISVAALCTAIGIPLNESAQLCNVAATQVCEKPGVACVDINTLLQRD
jgi:rfaE bifunctional protein kinase chain/domain